MLPIVALVLLFQANGPSFEVVSIKPQVRRLDGSISSRDSVDQGFLNYTNFTIKSLIRNAYGVTEHQISGPDWITDDLFDIHAKLPPGTDKSQVPAMLRNMLADRFRLTVDRTPKEMPVYALVVAKGGSKMKPIESNDTGWNMGNTKIEGRMVPMEQLAKLLSRVADRPVLDETGLSGKFAFVLQWGPDPQGPSIYTAVEEQLGLKLESRRMPAEMITITHVERNPTEN